MQVSARSFPTTEQKTWWKCQSTSNVRRCRSSLVYNIFDVVQLGCFINGGFSPLDYFKLNQHITNFQDTFFLLPFLHVECKKPRTKNRLNNSFRTLYAYVTVTNNNIFFLILAKEIPAKRLNMWHFQLLSYVLYSWS